MSFVALISGGVVQSFPFAAQEAVEECVLDLAAHVPAFAEKAFALKAQVSPTCESKQRFVDRRRPRVDAGSSLQTHVTPTPESFVHVALSPVSAAHCVTDLGSTVIEVEVEECRGADH